MYHTNPEELPVTNYTLEELVALAGTMEPANPTGPAATWLRSVAQAAEAADPDVVVPPVSLPTEDVIAERHADTAWFTTRYGDDGEAQMWQAFVELGAYRIDDVEDLGSTRDLAFRALRGIAHRLAIEIL